MDDRGKKITESLTWLDWVVYFLIATSVAMVLSFGLFGNTVVCVVLGVMHRFTLRKLLIRVFPEVYWE